MPTSRIKPGRTKRGFTPALTNLRRRIKAKKTALARLGRLDDDDPVVLDYKESKREYIKQIRTWRRDGFRADIKQADGNMKHL